MGVSTPPAPPHPRDPQTLIHRHKHRKPNHNHRPHQQIPPITLDHKLHAPPDPTPTPTPTLLPAQPKTPGNKMQQRIPQQPPHGERNHDGQPAGVDIRRDEREEEVWRARDVRCCEEGVAGGGEREEVAEEGVCPGGEFLALALAVRGGGRLDELGVEFVHDGAFLEGGGC